MDNETGYDRLTELALGFQPSRIFLTGVELDVFTTIGAGSPTAEDVARSIGADPRGMEILLNALAGLGLLAKSNGRYANTPVTAKFLDKSSPDYAGAGLGHTSNLWDMWSELTDIVKSGKPARPPRDEVEAQESLESFIMLMHERARYRAPKVADALDLSSVSGVLDIGGGPGTHSIEFARKNPNLCAVVFDLPDVVTIAGRIIREAGLQGQVTTLPGDYFADDFGSGYDLAFMSAIIHSNSPEGNKQVLTRAHEALNPGGRIAVVDFIMNDEKTSPEYGAIFAVNMLVATESGNCYSEKEIKEWFSETGFANPSPMHRIDEDISLITATKA